MTSTVTSAAEPFEYRCQENDDGGGDCTHEEVLGNIRRDLDSWSPRTDARFVLVERCCAERCERAARKAVT